MFNAAKRKILVFSPCSLLKNQRLTKAVYYATAAVAVLYWLKSPVLKRQGQQIQ